MEQTNYAATILSIVGVTLLEFYEPLLPWLLFAFMLILSDLRFGILASKKRGEEIRHSRMWRRTFNKAMDYVCWVTLAGLCSRSIGAAFLLFRLVCLSSSMASRFHPASTITSFTRALRRSLISGSS